LAMAREAEDSGGGGNGGARGSAGRGGGTSKLVVGRFDPTSVTREANTAPKAKRARQERRPVDKAEPDGIASVNPFFARVFRGGPKRKEADLPEREDEGREALSDEAPEAAEPSAATADWLSSLAVEGGGEAEEADGKDSAGVAPSALDWLSSIGAVGGKAKSAAPAPPPATSDDRTVEQDDVDLPPLPAAASKYAGVALPIPPFWRSEPLKKLDRRVRENRRTLLPAMRRLVREARKNDPRKGRARVGGGGRSHM